MSSAPTRTPQEVCLHDPCWCGRTVRLPDGVKPYNKKRADQWLKDRQKAREANVRG